MQQPTPPTKTPRDRFLEFDPNQTNALPFATYVQTRRVPFKTHYNRAVALNAFSISTNLAAFYNWAPLTDRWEPVAIKDRESRDARCDYCSSSTAVHKPPTSKGYFWLSHKHSTGKLDEAIYGTDMYDDGEFRWLRKNKKLIEPLQMLYLCSRCCALWA